MSIGDCQEAHTLHPTWFLMPSSSSSIVVLSWKTRNWNILPFVPTAWTVTGRSKMRCGLVWAQKRATKHRKVPVNSIRTADTDSTCHLTCEPYPIKLMWTCQGISKCEHEHLGSDLFRLQLTAIITSLQEIQCMGMRVRVVRCETW